MPSLNPYPLLRAIQSIGSRAVAVSKPSDVEYGDVESEEPLTIRVDDELLLEASQLELTRNVTDFDVDITVDHQTEEVPDHTHGATLTVGGAANPGGLTVTGSATGSTDPANRHLHDYTGRKVFRVHNRLLAGDRVMMIRHQGGQRFTVIDRVIPAVGVGL